MTEHGRFDEPEGHEYVVWAPDNEDGTPRSLWYVKDWATGELVAGPWSIDDAIRVASWCNAS